MDRERLSSALGRHRLEFTVASAVYVVTALAGMVAYVVYGTQLESSGYAPAGVAAVGLEEFTFAAVLTNNGFAALVSILGGLAAGIPTLINLLLNGFVFGILAGVVGTAETPLLAAATIAPHVVVEIPAFLVAAAVGFKLPRELVRYLIGRQSYLLDRPTLYDMLYAGVFALALVAFAAVLEVFVTPFVATSLGV